MPIPNEFSGAPAPYDEEFAKRQRATREGVRSQIADKLSSLAFGKKEEPKQEQEGASMSASDTPVDLMVQIVGTYRIQLEEFRRSVDLSQTTTKEIQKRMNEMHDVMQLTITAIQQHITNMETQQNIVVKYMDEAARARAVNSLWGYIRDALVIVMCAAGYLKISRM